MINNLFNQHMRIIIITVMARRIFNCDNLEETKTVQNLHTDVLYKRTISAAGCLIYKILGGEVYLLLIKYNDPNWPMLDDLGGRIDGSDTSVIGAITREVSEETNNVIDSNLFKSMHMTNSFYTLKSKYYVVLVRVDDNFCKDTTVFGDKEIHDNIYRTINWFNLRDVKDTLAQRISTNTDLVNFLEWERDGCHCLDCDPSNY